jgi:hypothetical protein
MKTEMQNIERRELTDAEMDVVSGGDDLGDAAAVLTIGVIGCAVVGSIAHVAALAVKNANRS